MAGAALLRRAAGLAIDKPTDVVIGKTLRNTAGEHAFQPEAEAVIAWEFVSVTLYLLMSLCSFT